jgi:hypothetical protein
MKAPTQCVLWQQPELIEGSMKERFEQLEIYDDDSHLWRYLLKCRECGQLYFFEFYEEIDWKDGEDPQYVTLIPVETPEEIETLKQSPPHGLLRFEPRLQKSFPKGAKTATIGWVGK